MEPSAAKVHIVVVCMEGGAVADAAANGNVDFCKTGAWDELLQVLLTGTHEVLAGVRLRPIRVTEQETIVATPAGAEVRIGAVQILPALRCQVAFFTQVQATLTGVAGVVVAIAEITRPTIAIVGALDAAVTVVIAHRRLGRAVTVGVASRALVVAIGLLQRTVAVLKAGATLKVRRAVWQI